MVSLLMPMVYMAVCDWLVVVLRSGVSYRCGVRRAEEDGITLENL